MKFVVASAFQRALAGLVLCFGLFAVLFTWSEPMQLDAIRQNPRAGVGGPGGLGLGYYAHSQWDVPIALGLLVASVLVAALIYPRRRA